MRSQPITIGEKSFESQKAANAFIQELLNSQPLKTPIPEPHHSFLRALIARHPNADKKIGVGIRHFTVESAAHGTICFYLTRTDGTRDDFATLKCVRGRD
ncbi:MAG: DCL family protein [Acidobacteriaceae bacterium]